MNNRGLKNFLQALAEHKKTEKGYQIQLNSGNLDEFSGKNTDVEIGDLYFTECNILKDTKILSFGNMGRKPTRQLEDGTNLYPSEINSQMFIDVDNIETVEQLADFEDWFCFPSEKVFNLYMLPKNDNSHGNRNVITVGFMC